MAMDGRSLGVRGLDRALNPARNALIALVAVGCSGKAPPSYPTFAPAETMPALTSDNGFWLYAQAADDVEAREGKLKTRVSFAEADKPAIYEATDNAIKLIEKGSVMKRDFIFQAHKPLERSPHQFGWKLIGYSLALRISEACRAGQYDQAVADVVLGTKFGFDLVGGDALDASLGYYVVDQSRKALLDSIDQLPPEQLQKLADGLQQAVREKPEVTKTIANDRLDMLEAVDAIQDAYRKNDYDLLLKRLGSDVRDAVKYLQDEVRPKDETLRPKYFEGFAKEAETEAAWETQQASEPAIRRNQKGPELESDRPWKRWAKNYFEGGRTVMRLDDAAVARTRLLALYALILAHIKTQKLPPSTIADFPPDLNHDPYTGGVFVYKAQGALFKVYSKGDNFRDDGGQSDSSYSHPDLKLEIPGS